MNTKEEIKSPVKHGFLIKAGRVTGWLLAFVVMLVLLAALVLQLPAVQRAAKNKAVSYLTQKTGVPVQIASIHLAFPEMLVLKGVYLPQPGKDTLLYAGRLGVQLGMLALLNGEVEINDVWLTDAVVKLSTDSTGRTNYTFLTEAFTTADSPEPIAKPTDSAKGEPLAIAADKLRLNRVRFAYYDTAGGIHIDADIAQLRAGIKLLKPEQMVFGLKKLDWHGGKLTISMSTPALTDKDTASTESLPLIIDIAKAEITEVDFDFAAPADGLAFQTRVGAMEATGLNFNLAAQTILFDDVQLSRSGYFMQSSPPAQAVPGTEALASPTKNWVVRAKRIGMEAGSFGYDDLAAASIARGMDYGHLGFKNINLSANNFYVNGGDTVLAQIEKGSLREKAGFTLNSLKGDLMYTANGIRLQNLLLTTPHSTIADYLEIGYESPAAVAQNPGKLFMAANLRKTKIGHADLLNVAPMLLEYPMFADFDKGSMQLQGKISGQLNNLLLDKVEASLFGGTVVKLSGRLQGLPDPAAIKSSLNVTELTTTSGDLKKIIPTEYLPGQIELPEKLTLKGSINGDPNNELKLNLLLNSSMGKASIKGLLRYITDSKRAVYDVSGGLEQFNIGQLLKMPQTVGRITLDFSAKGKKLDPADADGNYAINLKSAEVQGHTFKNLRVSGQANRGVFNINSSGSEAELDYLLTLYADMRGAYPSVSAELSLHHADLFKMGFTDFPLNFRADAFAIFPKLDVERPEGSFLVTSFEGIYDSLPFQLDTMALIASQNGGTNHLKFETDFAEGSIDGVYTLTGLFPDLQQYITRHYGFGAPKPALLGNQQASMALKIKPSNQLTQFLPGFDMKEALAVKLDFDSKLCIFDIKGEIPALTYGGNHITGGSLFAEGTDSSINFKIYLSEVGNETFAIPTALLQGEVVHNKVYADIRLLDEKGRLQHTLAGKMEQTADGLALHVDPSSVILNYDAWGLDPSNLLLFSDFGIYADQFTFSNGSQALIMQSLGNRAEDPLGIRLFNFEIGTFTGIARQDSLYLNGIINGTAEIRLDLENLVFETDLEVNNLSYKKDTLGDLIVKVHSTEADIFTIQSVYTGKGGKSDKASVEGSYNNEKEYLELFADIERLNLSSLEPFFAGFLTQPSGHLEGGLSISGKPANPDITGNLIFAEAEATVPLLNSRFSLKNERIRFLEDRIYFNQFTLRDAEGKTAILDGNILAADEKNPFRYQLDFSAKNFRVINSTRKNNSLFYGTLFIDSEIKIRGSVERPDVTASFRVNDKTDFTLVMPSDDPQLSERQGIVEFINPGSPEGDDLLVDRIDSLSTSNIKGMDLNASIEIDKNAIFNFVIDENNGDMLTSKGSGALYGGINPAGRITMTGTYELVEGSYETSLAIFSKKKFQIQKGSTITWTGEPTTADVDITAVYATKAAPYDLVESIIIGESATTKLRYRDRQPFDVKLNMKGELLKPEITFDLELNKSGNTASDLQYTINSKIDQLRLEQSEMNKQVFALVLLDRFVAENPFSSSGGSGAVSALARESVSRLLEDQLNNLAGGLIEGIELDFGLTSEEDFSTGSSQMRTDLNVGVSTRLLQDRLKISVGSNFELEGPSRPNQKTANIAGNIQLDYMLSRDGRYSLRAYRRDEYEVALQGQVVETGVSFIITIDFNTFKELIEYKKAKKAARSLQDEKK